MKNLGKIEIIRGEDFSKTFYLGTYKDIETSTDASPSVVTVPAHGFSSSQKKQITKHRRNLSINNDADNPFHTITVIDANTFSVPIAGIANGDGGEVMTPANLTGATVQCQFRKFGMADSVADALNVLFEPTVTPGSDGAVTVSIEKALTFKDNEDGLTLDKYRADILVTTSGGTDTYYCQFDVECVKSVSR